MFSSPLFLNMLLISYWTAATSSTPTIRSITSNTPPTHWPTCDNHNHLTNTYYPEDGNCNVSQNIWQIQRSSHLKAEVLHQTPATKTWLTQLARKLKVVHTHRQNGDLQPYFSLWKYRRLHIHTERHTSHPYHEFNLIHALGGKNAQCK
jgi:hypothetical protein